MHAGRSQTNVKTIRVPGVTSCAPNAANLDGARDRDCSWCGYDDKFKVAVPEPGLVSVQRVDQSAGWGMDLKFTCETGVLSGSAEPDGKRLCQKQQATTTPPPPVCSTYGFSLQLAETGCYDSKEVPPLPLLSVLQASYLPGFRLATGR